MLIVLDLVAVVLVAAMVIVFVAIVAVFQRFFLHGIGIVHHPHHGGDSFSGGGQNLLHPLLPLTAVVDENICPAHPDHIHGGGLKAVSLPPGGHQQMRLHKFRADLPDEIIVGE